MLWASLAYAQAKPKTLAAELSGDSLTSFEHATALFEVKDFATAHAKFKQAYELSKNGRLLWNMSACSVRQKRYGRAIVEAERYLAEGRGRLTPQQVETATTALRDWRAFTAEATLTLAPIGASVQLDEQPLGAVSGPVKAYLDIGKHELRLEKQGFEPFAAGFTIDEVGKVALAFSMKPLTLGSGHLVVNTDLDAAIEVDGKAVGKGVFDGQLAPGAHRLHVAAPGRQPFDHTIDVGAGASKQLTVSLVREVLPPLAPLGPMAKAPRGDSGDATETAWWPWAVGGVVAAGAGVLTYYLIKPETNTGSTVYVGTIGSVKVD